MLVAASVTTMASRPAVVSSKASCLASVMAIRRASPGWVFSSTVTTTVSIMFACS
jgi:hypothetical protein